MSASDWQITVEPWFHGRQASLGQPLEWQGKTIRFTRFDWLMSGLALQRADGSWLECDPAWAACYREDGEDVGTLTTGVPAESFRAIRFRLGLSREQHASDPADHAPGTALHPDACGLHWGWQGGYVFVALEGLWEEGGEGGRSGGFSYHLTNDFDRMVELPVSFDAASPGTLRLGVHLDRVLAGADWTKGETDTHSREGDPLASRLLERMAGAFEVVSVRNDVFQHRVRSKEEGKPEPVPSTATPYPLEITRRFPQAPLPADNPLSIEGVALGERLFHDTRLSMNGSQSCASCHDRRAAFADPRRLSIGAAGVEGRRNAMPLFNLAWGGGFFWDGRATTLREQVLMPVRDAHELNESPARVVEKLRTDPGTEEDFRRAFGSPGIDEERLAKALEQYLLRLVSQESKFDRAVRKLATLTEEEKRGLQLFVSERDPKRGLFGADCFHCHGGTLFTDHRYTSNGLDLRPPDAGRMEATGQEIDRGRFKTPSLRNVELTAPYMHDGRFATLEEVVAHYSQGVKRTANLDPNLAKHPDGGLNLSEEDQAALVAFLKTLTDEPFSGVDSPHPATDTTHQQTAR